MVKGMPRWQSISVFLLEDVSKFFEGIGEFPFGFLSLLGNVGKDGHSFDAQRDRYVFDLLKVELF